MWHFVTASWREHRAAQNWHAAGRLAAVFLRGDNSEAIRPGDRSMTKSIRRFLVLPLLLVLAACTMSAETAAVWTPVPPGAGRIVFYRLWYPDTPSVTLTLALNGRSIGTLPIGAAIYRNVAPGTYTISFTPTRPDLHQFKTVTLAPGEVFYVRIAALPQIACSSAKFSPGCDISGFTEMVQNPAVARSEMRGLQLVRG